MTVEAQQNGCIRDDVLHCSFDNSSSNTSITTGGSDPSVKGFDGNEGNLKQETTLQRFYTGKKIFVTGGTGFMGKILIEKLLRSCNGVETIYLLIRQKKGKDVFSRMEEIFNDTIFERLKREEPKFRQKIVAVHGECGSAGLGLSSTDRELLITQVDLVFHAAATVRFNESLRSALAINVHGVRDMMALCKNMRNLKALIHVSTAYSNCNLEYVEEKFYPFPMKLEELETLVGELDVKEVEELLPKILGNWPNTYTFTKALAENMIRQQSSGLNMGIFRPAVVTSTASEPIEGWINNFYGPTGFIHAIGTGALRTIQVDSSYNSNILPVDLCVNALLTTAWEVTNSAAERKGEDMLIYNYVSDVENPLNWQQFYELIFGQELTHPFSNVQWYAYFHINKSAAMNRIKIVLLQYLPAILLDGLALCSGKKPTSLQSYEKVHKFAKSVSYFGQHKILFSNSNVQNLWKKLEKNDQKIFNFSISSLDWKKYFSNYIKGMRKYLLKDDDSSLELARKQWKRFYYLHQFVKLTIISLMLSALWLFIGKHIFGLFL